MSEKNQKFWIAISTKCNNQCIFCHDVDNQKNGKFKDISEIRTELETAQAQGAKRVILSGGEASIHPQFIEIVELTKDLGFSEIQTISNGRFFYYKDFVKKAVNAGLTEITFSIHGHNSDLHDEITQVNGSFDQVLKALDNFLIYPQVIKNIDIVINKKNYQHIYDIIMFFSKNYNIYEYDLLQLVPFGRAWKNKKDLFYDFEKAKPYLKKVFELAKNDDHFHIWTNRLEPKLLEGYEFLIQDPAKIRDEINGRKKSFLHFLNDDKDLSCKDKERCDFCFIRDYCSKLEQIKNGADARIFLKQPECLNMTKQGIEIDFISNGKINLDKYTEFYINYLYKVKSIRCNECKKDDECYGVDIALIVNKGFEILKPIK